MGSGSSRTLSRSNYAISLSGSHQQQQRVHPITATIREKKYVIQRERQPLDENDRGDRGLHHHHYQQDQGNSLPDQGRPSTSARTTSSSNASFRSVAITKRGGASRLALDDESVIVDNVIDVEQRLRKEYEMFKLETENEITTLEKVKKKLMNENRRLRAELQALEKMVAKLKNERDLAVEAELRALERAEAFETDRNKIQKQFKIYRETRESELQHLLKTIQKQENARDGNREERRVEGSTEHRPNPDLKRKRLGSLEKWESVDSDTSCGSQIFRTVDSPMAAAMETDHLPSTVKRDDGDKLPSAVGYGVQILANTPSAHTNIYACSSTDLEETVQELKKFLPGLELECEKADILTSFVYCPIADPLRPEDTWDSRLHTRHQLIRKSSIFIGLLGAENKEEISNEINFATKSDDADDCQQRTCILVCDEDTMQSLQHDRQQWLFVVSVATQPTATETALEITDKLRDALLGKHNNKNGVADEDFCVPFDEAALLRTEQQICGGMWDGIEDFLQYSRLQHALMCDRHLLPENQLMQLRLYVTQPGLLSPLLVSGMPGSGRSSLLVNSITSVQGQYVVLYHSVASMKSSSANPGLLMRRILVQLMEKTNSSAVLTTNPTRLQSEFSHWLEKLSSKLGSPVVLLLDGIDRCQNAEEELFWLLDPLPLDVRVIVSVDSQTCPSSWRLWPTVHLESQSSLCTKTILEMHCLQANVELVEVQESRILAKLCAEDSSNITALFVNVFCSAVARTKGGDRLDEFLDVLLECNDATELFLVLIEDLHQRQANGTQRSALMEVLTLLVVSCDGLVEPHLPQFLSSFSWEWWHSLTEDLTALQILLRQPSDTLAMLCIAHDQAATALEHFCFQEDQENLLQEAQCQLAEVYMNTVGIYGVPLWTATELPKILRNAEDVENLRSCVANVWVFFLLYTRGRTAELLEYFHILEIEDASIYSIYVDQLKEIEVALAAGNQSVSAESVAAMYEALGCFLRDLGTISHAVIPLQRALELHETVLDPDHPSIAQAFRQLAMLHSQWGKWSTAEALHKQALETLETSLGPDNPRVARELDVLVTLYHKQGKHDLAESLHQRSIFIKKKCPVPCLYQVPKQRSSALVKDFPLIDVMPTLEAAATLNTIGVNFYLNDDLETAEHFMNKALTIRKHLLGPNHADCAQILNNLAGVLVRLGNLTQAEAQYQKALNIRMQTLPPDSPLTAAVVSRLASVYLQQDKVAEMLSLHQCLIDLRIAQCGGQHLCVAKAKVNKAVTLSQQNRHDDALPLYQQALTIFTDALGPEHSQVATTLKNMALLHYQKGDYATAAQLYKQSIEITTPVNAETQT